MTRFYFYIREGKMIIGLERGEQTLEVKYGKQDVERLIKDLQDCLDRMEIEA